MCFPLHALGTRASALLFSGGFSVRIAWILLYEFRYIQLIFSGESHGGLRPRRPFNESLAGPSAPNPPIYWGHNACMYYDYSIVELRGPSAPNPPL